MAQPRRLFRFCVPVLLSWLCAVESGCQCSFSCAPTFKGPNCGPNGCGGGPGCGYGGGPNCGPAGAGQWAQTGRDASQQPGQWGQGCNAPMGGGYAQAPAYPVMQQGYQPAIQPPQQQQQTPVQLGPTPLPERAPDRMPNAQGNNNMMVPYPGTLTNGQFMQGGGSNPMPFSQGVQGVPFGPGPSMQQGNPNMPGPMSRPGNNENTLPAPRIMPTEAPYSP
jgi:hypothetical protein